MSETRPLLFHVAFAAAMTLLSTAEEPVTFAPRDAEKAEPAWKPVYQGIDYRFDELSKPRFLRIHSARIDTKAAGIRFFATPDNGEKPGEVDGRRTATFLKEFDLELAINGTGFKPITAEREPVDVLGLSVSDGKVVSPVDRESGNPVFLITAANEARILRAPFKAEDLLGAHNALQGWYGANGMLLDDGEIVTTTRDIHPRTAAGVSQDGRYVYLLVVDGRQKGFSEGMNLIELAAWMKHLGCWDALNFDGGGSTTLVMKTPVGSPRIVNSPSGGVQRSVANHLGVHAEPLPEKR
jgi:uncharacterized protein YigE (DUF2233 family)